MSGNDPSDVGGSATGDENVRGASRRRFIKATAGAGILAAGGSIGVGLAGAAEVTDTQFSAGSVTSGTATNAATVTQSGDTFLVDGRVGLSHPCHTAQLASATVDGDALHVVVEAVSTLSSGEACTMVLASVEYVAEVTVSGSISRVVVEHHGSSEWQTEWSSPDGTATDTATPYDIEPIFPPPQDLTADVVGSRRVDLSWIVYYPGRPGQVIVDHFNVYVDGMLSEQVPRGTNQVTVSGLDPGSTHEFTVKSADADGNETQGVSVTATTESLDDGMLLVDGTLPRDLDGDGTYEDLNGNNRTDNDDVVTYFEYMNDPAIANNVGRYDFNGNGRIDFDDLVTLFEML